MKNDTHQGTSPGEAQKEGRMGSRHSGESLALLDYLGTDRRYDSIVFFDVETTGIDADRDRIIELAVLRAARDRTDQEDFFIRLPENQMVPEKIVNLTGITNEMVQRGIPEAEAVERFAAMLEGQSLLVAHNAQFDLNFAGMLLMRHYREHREWMRQFVRADYLDTLTVLKDRRQYPHRLADAITAYHLEDKVQNTHRAIDDVLALYEVTRALAEERSDLRDYINIFGYNPKYGTSGKMLKKVTYVSQGFHDYMCSEEQTLPALLRKKRKREEAAQ